MVKGKTRLKFIVDIIDREDNMYREVGNNNTWLIQQLRTQLHQVTLENNELKAKGETEVDVDSLRQEIETLKKEKLGLQNKLKKALEKS